MSTVVMFAHVSQVNKGVRSSGGNYGLKGLSQIRPEGQRFQRAACALASVMAGVSAAASLRNAAARPKVSPMVWPAR